MKVNNCILNQKFKRFINSDESLVLNNCNSECRNVEHFECHGCKCGFIHELQREPANIVSFKLRHQYLMLHVHVHKSIHANACINETRKIQKIMQILQNNTFYIFPLVPRECIWSTLTFLTIKHISCALAESFNINN